jgi:hypothetical protein
MLSTFRSSQVSQNVIESPTIRWVFGHFWSQKADIGGKCSYSNSEDAILHPTETHPVPTMHRESFLALWHSIRLTKSRLLDVIEIITWIFNPFAIEACPSAPLRFPKTRRSRAGNGPLSLCGRRVDKFARLKNPWRTSFHFVRLLPIGRRLSRFFALFTRRAIATH